MARAPRLRRPRGRRPARRGVRASAARSSPRLRAPCAPESRRRQGRLRTRSRGARADPPGADAQGPDRGAPGSMARRGLALPVGPGGSVERHVRGRRAGLHGGPRRERPRRPRRRGAGRRGARRVGVHRRRPSARLPRRSRGARRRHGGRPPAHGRGPCRGRDVHARPRRARSARQLGRGRADRQRRLRPRLARGRRRDVRPTCCASMRAAASSSRSSHTRRARRSSGRAASARWTSPEPDRPALSPGTSRHSSPRSPRASRSSSRARGTWSSRATTNKSWVVQARPATGRGFPEGGRRRDRLEQRQRRRGAAWSRDAVHLVGRGRVQRDGLPQRVRGARLPRSEERAPRRQRLRPLLPEPHASSCGSPRRCRSSTRARSSISAAAAAATSSPDRWRA